jgi:hypothetical protein
MQTAVTGAPHDEEEGPGKEKDEGAVTSAGDWVPDLHWLTGDLAVGGCFPVERAADLSSEYGIRAIVDLREEDCDDEQLLREHGIHFLHLPTPDLEAASVTTLERGVRFVRDHLRSGDKVLIHCQHGIGRSALLALCVLVDQGWEPIDALKHAKDRREAVSPSESQYLGWSNWLASCGKPVPDYHSFGCIAYRHLASG